MLITTQELCDTLNDLHPEDYESVKKIPYKLVPKDALTFVLNSDVDIRCRSGDIPYAVYFDKVKKAYSKTKCYGATYTTGTERVVIVGFLSALGDSTQSPEKGIFNFTRLNPYNCGSSYVEPTYVVPYEDFMAHKSLWDEIIKDSKLNSDGRIDGAKIKSLMENTNTRLITSASDYLTCVPSIDKNPIYTYDPN